MKSNSTIALYLLKPFLTFLKFKTLEKLRKIEIRDINKFR
jgi:hypothetical protein